FTVILVTLVLQGLTLPLVVRWVNMKDPDYVMPMEEQEIRIRKKMALAALELLNGKYAAEIQANELLQALHAKLETDAKVSEQLQHRSPNEEPAGIAVARYRKIYVK